MEAPDKTGRRGNQRQRTRKDLLRAAARLLESGTAPSMDAVAEEAMVSRATAYRYFPTIEALLVEAPMDGEVSDLDRMFAGDPSTDPSERLDRAEAAMHDMLYRNEAQLRLMLAYMLQTSLSPAARDGGPSGEAATPLRQNRRGALIEAALAPARARFDDAAYDDLTAALTLVFGTESTIVFRDVLPISPERAREVKSWAIRALVAAALERSSTTPEKTARRARPRPRAAAR